MHLLYKICRADNPEALHSDFLISTADPETSFDDVDEKALEETKVFLAKTSAVNCQHEEHKGATHLWLRAEQGHAKAVHEILRHPQVEPNVVRKDTETTPLFIASHHGHEEAVKVILSHPKTRVNQGKLGSNTSPLYQAVQGGHEGVVEALLEVKGVDVNQATAEGYTPLGKACEIGNEHIVKLLLSMEGINAKGHLHGGNTALSIASDNSNADIADMLRAHGIHERIGHLGMDPAPKSNDLRPAAAGIGQWQLPSETIGTPAIGSTGASDGDTTKTTTIGSTGASDGNTTETKGLRVSSVRKLSLLHRGSTDMALFGSSSANNPTAPGSSSIAPTVKKLGEISDSDERVFSTWGRLSD